MKKMLLVIIMVAVFMTVGKSNVFAAGALDGGTIVSPFWLVTPNSTITFLTITNPSIAGSATRVVTVDALDTTGASLKSVAYTVAPGAQAKVFIAATPGLSRAGTNEFDHIIDSAVEIGGQLIITESTGNASSISMWGAVFFLGSSSGFAMEFIGDITDSLVVAPEQGL